MIELAIFVVIAASIGFMGWIAWVGPRQADRAIKAAWRKVRASLAGASQ